MSKQTSRCDNLSEESGKSTWHPHDGWNGLVPGISKVSDAIARFGSAKGEVEFGNGKWLEFVDKSVQVVILNRDPETIAKIRILATFPDKNLVPIDIDGIKKIFGDVKEIEVDEFAMVTYERPGLRVACHYFEDPQPVEWIEFYPVDM